jgi:hypothetical protein
VSPRAVYGACGLGIEFRTCMGHSHQSQVQRGVFYVPFELLLSACLPCPCFTLCPSEGCCSFQWVWIAFGRTLYRTVTVLKSRWALVCLLWGRVVLSFQAICSTRPFAQLCCNCGCTLITLIMHFCHNDFLILVLLLHCCCHTAAAAAVTLLLLQCHYNAGTLML